MRVRWTSIAQSSRIVSTECSLDSRRDDGAIQADIRRPILQYTRSFGGKDSTVSGLVRTGL